MSLTIGAPRFQSLQGSGDCFRPGAAVPWQPRNSRLLVKYHGLWEVSTAAATSGGLWECDRCPGVAQTVREGAFSSRTELGVELAGFSLRALIALAAMLLVVGCS